MNENEFESRLQQTPLRRPPAEWREEILGHATCVAADAGRGDTQRSPVDRRTSPVCEHTFAVKWRMRVRELFWPHPAAWAAIAAAWMAIGLFNAGFATHEQRPAAPSGTIQVVWHTMLLEEVAWQEESLTRSAPEEPLRTNSQPAPRSQSMMEWRMI